MLHRRTTGHSRSLLVLLAIVALISTPAAGMGQGAVEWDPRTAAVDRAELTELLARLEEAATAPGYSQQLKARARLEADFVRNRLEEGDFQIGDRIALDIRGEPELSDTLTVLPGRVIEVAQIGRIPLEGVLRSELQAFLTNEISRFVRDPALTATALVRVGVMGAVGRQGFYTVPATMLLEDAIMAAGGPVGRADLGNILIERGDRTVWSGSALQTALVEGRTLDQLNLRAGDRIVVPERQAGFFEGGVIRTLLVTVPPLLFLLLRIS